MKPPGLRGPGAGRHPGIHDVDVHREEDGVAPVRHGRERLVQTPVEATRDDLRHLVGTHPLARHPGERLRVRPVPAESDLHEPVATNGSRLQQPPHRLAVPQQRAELRVAGVGVCVEVDDADTPHPYGRATAVASAIVIEWSPPKISGIAPAPATLATEASRSRRERTASPLNISTSPASTTPRSRSGSTRRFGCLCHHSSSARPERGCSSPGTEAVNG